MLHQPIPQASAMRRITVLQGQVRVSDDPGVELGTVLGSCVAACLFDSVARVGGMNHFLLAEPPANHKAGDVDVHYGVYLMELLINEMLGQGALKSRIRAHLYGGAGLPGARPTRPVPGAFWTRKSPRGCAKILGASAPAASISGRRRVRSAAGSWKPHRLPN